jgi:predicted GTPase
MEISFLCLINILRRAYPEIEISIHDYKCTNLIWLEATYDKVNHSACYNTKTFKVFDLSDEWRATLENTKNEVIAKYMQERGYSEREINPDDWYNKVSSLR